MFPVVRLWYNFDVLLSTAVEKPFVAQSLSNKLVKYCLSLYVCVCLNVNQGGTNRNRCTQTLVILHAQTY